ncbi:MAG: phosphatase PAP2 family protein, partial [Actinomycetes bacterium]
MLTLRVVNAPRVLAAALALCALLVIVAVLARDPLPGESAVLRWVHAEAGSTPARLWQTVSDATDLLPLLVVAAVGVAVLLVVRRPRSAALVVSAVAVPWTLNPLLKEVFGRDRPDLWPLGDVSQHSFPAGHAANTAALLAAVVAVLLPRTTGRGRLAPVVLASAVLLLAGAAQLALGRHYPSDVLAGWLWAGAWVAFVVSLLPVRSEAAVS